MARQAATHDVKPDSPETVHPARRPYVVPGNEHLLAAPICFLRPRPEAPPELRREQAFLFGRNSENRQDKPFL